MKTKRKISKREWRAAVRKVVNNRENIIKDSNPKDAIGMSKIPLGSVIPGQVLVGMALGMLEGACKYRRHNYRVVGVRASVYYDAAKRHLDAWWEGQDMDGEAAIPIHHLDKLLSDIAVLRDAMLQDKCFDDRPPPVKNQRWIQEANARTKELLAKFPNAKPPYVIGDDINEPAAPVKAKQRRRK